MTHVLCFLDVKHLVKAVHMMGDAHLIVAWLTIPAVIGRAKHRTKSISLLCTCSPCRALSARTQSNLQSWLHVSQQLQDLVFQWNAIIWWASTFLPPRIYRTVPNNKIVTHLVWPHVLRTHDRRLLEAPRSTGHPPRHLTVTRCHVTMTRV